MKALVRRLRSPEQTGTYNLQTRTNKRTDSRSRGWEGGSVEVDAIPPAALQNLVRNCIERHMDRGACELVRYVEQEEETYFPSSCRVQRFSPE
jgi:hypothetical protein